MFYYTFIIVIGMRCFFSLSLAFLIVISVFSAYCTKAFAYTTGMSASIVLGQQNFTSSSSNQGGSANNNTLNSPSSVIVAENKLIVADNSNQRILIYNTIPTSSNVSADVVIGQSSMTTTSSGCAANKFNLGEGGIFYINGKLLVADSNNNRVLIFNSIPKSNGVSADLVVGQSNFTTCTSGASAKTLNAPYGVTSDGKQLIIADYGNNRVLVYKSFPIANNPSADFVIGQINFSSIVANNNGEDGTTLASPSAVAINTDGMLAVSDSVNARVLLYNGIPNSTGVSADNVLGQVDFISKSAVAKIQPFGIATDPNGALFISEKTYNRVGVFSSFSSVLGTTADIVIGQSSLSGTATNSGSLSATSLSSPKGAFSTGTQLFIADSGNNRVLIYNNTNYIPTIAIDNKPQGQVDGTFIMNGSASVNPVYTIKDVQFSTNGGGWYDATPTDGLFNSSTENFTFNFDPITNNNTQAGFGVRMRAFNSNGDVSGTAFFFQPFEVNKPDDNSFLTTPYPVFDFSVNTQRTLMRDSLLKYQIWISPSDVSNWQVYIDNIPIDFQKVGTSADNLQKGKYSSQDINGTYDTTNITAVYAENSSHVLVSAKETQQKSFESGGKALNGAYQWKVVAVDPAGHTQNTAPQFLRVNARQTQASRPFFPLDVLFISGIGNTNLSSLKPDDIANEYTTSVKNPIFYGIAFVNATVILTLTDSDCSDKDIANCTDIFTTTANTSSRFGINVSDGMLQSGKKYIALLSAQLNNDYVELPTFTLSVASAEKSITKPVKINKNHTSLLQVNNFSCNGHEEKNFTYLLKPAEYLLQGSCLSARIYPFTLLHPLHA